MSGIKKIILTTKRLEVRNLSPLDLDNFHIYRSNEEVTKYQGFDIMTVEECDRFIDDQKDKEFGTPGEWIQYGIIDHETNNLIGDCAIKLQKEDPRIAEIGITISHLKQRNGFAKEALMGILGFLFDQHKIHRVVEIVDAENIASIKLLESIGFRQEGHFIENIFFKGKWGSEFQYAMLRRDWEKKKSQVSVATYNKSAEGYQNRFMEMELYHDVYDKFCDLVDKKNPNVFEIACGPGNVSAYLMNKRKDFQLSGTDLAPNMVALAQRNVPGAKFEVMDCRDILSISAKFDAIMCGFVMPYLSKKECTKLLEDSSALLEEGGIIYFSTMEDEYEKSGYETTSFSGDDEVYIHYHQEVFLSKQLENNGFQTIEFQRKLCPEPDGRFLTDMIFIARKVR